jgi:hypothetical protein
MKRITVAATEIMALALCMAGAANAQMQPGYVDVEIFKIKPDKRADFDALCRKTTDANRRYKGDTFLALQTEYGEQNTVLFVSTRENYAAIDKAMTAFTGAMKEAYTPTVMTQMDQDLAKCVISSRAELRRRRWDLSINAPADAAAISKAIGEARWLRTLAVHVRPGRVDDFEAQLKVLKAGREKTSGPMTLVSQSVAGQEGTIFYLSTLRNSLADFDQTPPPLREVLGDSSYEQFQRSSADDIVSTESALFRFLPELSNAPKEVAEASPDFWNPKPAAGSRSRSKPKAAEPPKTGQ